MDSKEVISRIGCARHNAKLSARQLSEEVGMNSAYISRLESDKSFEPSVSVLLKIISACGMTEEEFFYHDMINYKTDKKYLIYLLDVKMKRLKKPL